MVVLIPFTKIFRKIRTESKWNTNFCRLRGRVCVKRGSGRGRGRENLGARTLAAQSRLFGEGKRRNEFVEWHVAWLAE